MFEQNADNRFFLLDRSGTIAEINLIDILPLITVWLQVRVPPGHRPSLRQLRLGEPPP
jgi:hypothetical protein